MSHGLHITVEFPGATIDIDAKGVTQYVGDSSVWHLSLAEAERRFTTALRSVQAVLEVEPGREASDWRTTRGTDPTLQPSPAPSTGVLGEGEVAEGGDEEAQRSLVTGCRQVAEAAEAETEDGFAAINRIVVGASLSPSTPYCPFCGHPTCQCWDSHVCR